MAVFRHLAKAMPRHESHKCGKRLCFHGSFTDKTFAVTKERETPGAFIIEQEHSGTTYYLVVTEKMK